MYEPWWLSATAGTATAATARARKNILIVRPGMATVPFSTSRTTRITLQSGNGNARREPAVTSRVRRLPNDTLPRLGGAKPANALVGGSASSGGGGVQERGQPPDQHHE